MRKALITFSCILITGLSLAQQVTLDFLDQETFRYDDFILDEFAFDIGPSGQGVVYDFRDLETVAYREGSIIEKSKGSPFEHLFPDANYVSFPQDKSKYRYYNYTKSALLLIGSIELKDSIYTFHTGMDTLVRYPMQYGDAWSYKTVNIEKNKTGKIDSGYSRVDTHFEVDAEGKVLFPDSSEHDVLRLRTTVNFDSDAFTKGKFRFKKLNKRIRYSWFIPAYPMAEIVYHQVDSIQYVNEDGDLLKEKVIVKCAGNDPVFDASTVNETESLDISTSPLGDEWLVRFDAKEHVATQFMIYDGSGKLLEKLDFNRNDVFVGANEKRISHRDYAKGIYIIRIVNGDHVDVTKVVKP